MKKLDNLMWFRLLSVALVWISAAHSGYSQLASASLNTRTFKEAHLLQSGQREEQKVSLKEVLDAFKKQYNLKIAYKQGLLDDKVISSAWLNTLNEAEAELTLKKMLASCQLSYQKINDHQFTLFPATATGNASLSAYADEIKGKITSSLDASPIPGASVYIKGTQSGTIADEGGNFKLLIPDNLKGQALTLVVSFVGFITEEVAVNTGQAIVNVVLAEDVTSLSEVVVTALGIAKDKKALAYSVTEVKGEEFTQAREINVANALTGKVAGVNASGLATGPGGSSRVIIRGNGSLNGNNQPLYVVNGMPIDNTTPGGSATTNGGGLNVDRGDGIAGINPDDIESISVLKGGTAAALYGSRAANGVILITTKKGHAQKGIGLEYNSTLSFETPAVLPKWQYEYGQGDGGVKPATQQQAIDWGRRSFGAKMDGQPYTIFNGTQQPYSPQKDNIKHFYNTGHTFTNTLAFTGGNESINFRFSLSDLDSKGILPNSAFNKKIANANINAKIGSKITIETVAQYNLEEATNRPSAGDAPGNPNWAAYMIANTVDVRQLDPGYDANGREIQWNETPYASNSYFVVNRFQNKDTKNRFIGQASIRYDLLKNLFVKGTVSRDFYNYDYTGIIPTGTVYTQGSSGEYHGIKSSVSETNSMLTLNYNTSLLSNFNLSAMIGGNKRNSTSKELYLDGTQFIIPFFYSYTNLTTPQPARPNTPRSANNSLFGSVDMDYKGLFFLTLTGRQDWFSTLPASSNSIFYPSVGSSFILSEAVSMPSWFTYAKVRGSWAQVGGATDPYILNQTYSMVPSGGLPLQGITQSNGVNLVTNPNLRPLTSTTIEIGFDAQFLKKRLGLDVTFYDRRTTDDIVRTAISPTSGYNDALLNIGKLSNKGIEVLVTGTPIKTNNLTWNTSYNVAYNKNEVVQLAAGLNTIQMATSVGGWAFVNNTVGQPYGVIKGYRMKRDAAGNIIYNTSTGYAQKSDLMELGQGVPPLTMGWTNNFTYKRFALDILIDGKFGNKVFSTMDVYATRFGLHKSTLAGRENGLPLKGVDAEGNVYERTVPVANLRLYYDNNKNYTELFLYDGSFIKLRQVILSYNIPVSKFKLLKLQSASLSFVARNLAILYKKTDNFDPESSYTNGNAQGFEAFSMPRTRNYGFNLKVKF